MREERVVLLCEIGSRVRPGKCLLIGTIHRIVFSAINLGWFRLYCSWLLGFSRFDDCWVIRGVCPFDKPCKCAFRCVQEGVKALLTFAKASVEGRCDGFGLGS